MQMWLCLKHVIGLLVYPPPQTHTTDLPSLQLQMREKPFIYSSLPVDSFTAIRAGNTLNKHKWHTDRTVTWLGHTEK
jgi:hypothetical protein